MKHNRYKRILHDKCNICGNEADLTWDHVPPKSCQFTLHTECRSPFDINELMNIYYVSQSGVRFRSLCSKCNNMLGSKYDTEYLGFVNTITKGLEQLRKTTLSKYNVSVQINKLCRSVVGHLLAAKNFYDDTCGVDIELREYLLDESLAPPKELCLLVRFYPYDAIYVLRDVVPACVQARTVCMELPTGMVSLLNSAPLAYTLAYKGQTCGLVDIFNYASSNIDEVCDIEIDIASMYFPNSNILRDARWPANIHPTQGVDFVIGGRSVSDGILGTKRFKV